MKKESVTTNMLRIMKCGPQVPTNALVNFLYVTFKDNYPLIVFI